MLIVKKLLHSRSYRKCKDRSHVTLVEGPFSSRSPERTAWHFPEVPSAGLHIPARPGWTTGGSLSGALGPQEPSEAPLPGDAPCLPLPSPMKGLRAHCMDAGVAVGLSAPQPPPRHQGMEPRPVVGSYRGTLPLLSAVMSCSGLEQKRKETHIWTAGGS